ncbi:MAG: methylamine utilization protein [Armatimonadetes bacterium]|nr:methylamine utilization protein [Armatimonadota bacterium]MDE2207599.1 methylamine utilization protein [Armatimonadota bacterium]
MNSLRALRITGGARVLGAASCLAAASLLCLSVGARADGVAGKVMAGNAALVDAVISIEGAHGHASPAAMHAVIDQQNKTFNPHVVAVMKGGTVEFRNSDDFLHNTYSTSKTGTFNLSQPGRGSRSLLKVDKVGPIDVRCHIHASMHAWIVVVDTPYFAVSDARGLFRIPGVPAGTYTVKVWSEKSGLLTEKLTVTAHSEARLLVKYAK